MNQNVFVICRQDYYLSGSIHYQTAENNPVVAVFDNFLNADAFCDRCTKSHLLPSEKVEVIDYHSSTGLQVSYVARDANTGIPVRAYNIIKDYVL